MESRNIRTMIPQLWRWPMVSPQDKMERHSHTMSGQTNIPARPFITQVAAARVFTSMTFVAVATSAIGALAIGAVAIGALSLKRGKIESLTIEDLEVGRLRVRELIIDNE